MYLVETETHQFWKRHADQLKEVSDSLLKPTEFEVVSDWDRLDPAIHHSPEPVRSSVPESSESTLTPPESAIVIPDSPSASSHSYHI